MCLCDTPSGLWQLVALSQASRAGPDPVPLAIVYCGLDSYLPTRGLDARLLPASCPVSQLDLNDEPFADLMAAAGLKLESQLADSSPSAVVSHGMSDALLICTLMAKKHGLGILRLEAGRRGGDDSLNPILLDRLADSLHAERIADRDALLREGDAVAESPPGRRAWWATSFTSPGRCGRVSGKPLLPSASCRRRCRASRSRC
jgi:hypothetical protein